MLMSIPARFVNFDTRVFSCCTYIVNPQVLKDGAALQLLQIILTAFFGMIFYTLWKLCERLILDRLTRNK